MPASGPLLRPSSLARFWELHPGTVLQWIHAGRLPAVRSPGGQWRVRGGDLVEFCARSSLPLPPGARPRAARLAVIGGSAAALRAIEAAVRDLEATVEPAREPLEGLLGAVQSPPAVLVLDASSRALDVGAAVRALRKVGASLPVVVLGARDAAAARALVRAGATRALRRGESEATLASTLADLLAR